jgi:hypothetical protein
VALVAEPALGGDVGQQDAGPPDQELIAGCELRVVNDVLGHLGLFGAAPTFVQQIDQHLGDLLATEV